ncbi:helix-turn-helix transcriptional regulator [Streptomyces sp. NPDC049879]|uniref:helix-turn-helix transcriptional regulator n=1 Tax=Streptomyces sp. NPDC049879 TaxID=3365598 RepID=UPI0037B09C4A
MEVNMVEVPDTHEDFKEPPSPQQRFGADVRAVRLGRKLTQKHLATATNYTIPYVSQVESGKFMPSQRFAEGCDKVFGTNGLFAKMRERLQEEDHPQSFLPYVSLERKAASIRRYSGLFIEGLFQTEEYQHAIFRAGHPSASEEIIASKIKARTGRRELLTRERPPKLWSILHEAALHCRVAGREAMHRQLEHLLQMAKRPGIDVQVVPYSAGAEGMHWLAFTVLEFDNEPTVAYMDDPQGGRVYRRPQTVQVCIETFDRFRANALPISRSLELIDIARKDYEA